MMGSAAVTREGIQALVAEAAAQAFNSERLVVRLHPGDLAALRDAGALEPVLPSGALVSWAGDQGIALGGCIVETDSGELDARLETQMARLRATLLAARA
jgi:flagellar assembly protein FliH